MSKSNKTSLFISYRRADSPDTVKLIYERLRAELPRWEIFYDHKSIPPGEAFPERLRVEVISAAVVLVIIGPRWLDILRERNAQSQKNQSKVDHVREEVRLAIESNRLVIPVPVANARLSATDMIDFPDVCQLTSFNSRPIRPEPDFDNDIARLVRYLESVGPGEGIGTVLDGKYKIISELGVGGMGVVYAAEQLQPRRTIAVKLIKPGMDSREVLARFEAERQALGVMDHPNIAKVLDAGTAVSGRPYFAMEYVKGIPITEYCDQHKLSPADRLLLFKQVCGAVQHAHQKGIIHRDIKPSNVLVETAGGKAVPKVIDFGLAKALGYKLTDKTLMTTIDTRLGTLEYSSPEQSAGRTLEVDTRTDIYSLGALLYELLAGAPPFSRDELLAVGDEEMRRVIRENDPPRPSAKLSSSNSLPMIAANRHLEPSKLTGMVRGDLDWIVMKALEKEPRRRYETATSLSNDVDRFLAHEPIEARPPSSRYVLGKFIRRNRGAVISGAAILATLLAGLIGTGLGLNWALIERGRAKQNEQRAIENETLAREQSDLALKSLESVIVDIQTNLKNVAGGAQLRRKLLQTAMERLQEVSDKFASRKTIDRNTVVAGVDLADVFMRIGSESKAGPFGEGPLKSAQKLYEQAFEIAEKLVATDPLSTIARRDLSNIYDKLGDVQFRFGNLAAALEHYQRGFEIRQSLADEDPESNLAARSLFISLENIGDIQLQYGRLDDAKETYRRSQEITEKIAARNPNDPQAQRDLAFSWGCLGRLQLQSGELTAAESSFQKTLKINQKLTIIDPGDARDQRNLAVDYDCLGIVGVRSQKFADALRSYQESLAIRNKLAAADPSDALAQRDLSFSYIYVGDVQLQLGKLPESIASFQQALEIREKLAAYDPDDLQAQGDLSLTYDHLSKAQLQSGKLDAALEFCQKSLEIRKTLAAIDPRNVIAQQNLATSFLSLGDVQLRSSKWNEALSSFQKALEIRQNSATVDSSDVDNQGVMARIYHNIGEVHLQTREFDKSLESFQKALEINQKLATIDERDAGPQQALSNSFAKIGLVHLGMRKLTEARSDYQRALEIQQRMALASPNDFYLPQSLSSTYDQLGDVELQLGQAAKAMEYFQLGLDINEKLAVIDPSNSQTQRQLFLSHKEIGDLRLNSSDYVEAKDSYRKCLEIAQKLAATDPNDARFQRDLWLSHYGLAASAQGADEFLFAIECYERVREIMVSVQARGELTSQDHKILAVLDQLIDDCKSVELVLGDWNTLLEQPDNLLPGLLESRAISLVKKGRLSDAIMAVERLRELGTATPEQLYNSACVFSLSSIAIKSEANEISAEQTEQHNQYIAEALATLREAIAAGWSDFAHMKSDPDLAPLRNLDEFKKLFPADNGK
ncbi:MAG: tetratricopeptide repeat protein [Pirellulaceae bacterium]|nr:tetratricopeptide repeat protein [Pirellulaceae bacterium]